MPIFEVDTDERWPDYSLRLSEGKPGITKESVGLGWHKVIKIELTDAEYADLKRVEAEYDAWMERIDGTITALGTGPA